MLRFFIDCIVLQDIVEKEKSLEEVYLKENVDTDSEGQDTKEVKDLNSKSRYQIRVRPKSSQKRPGVRDEFS